MKYPNACCPLRVDLCQVGVDSRQSAVGAGRELMGAGEHPVFNAGPVFTTFEFSKIGKISLFLISLIVFQKARWNEAAL